MKNILIILLFVAAFINAKSQQTYKPSRHAGPQNKPSGISSATPLDSRSYFYDSTTFTYRPYASRAEILSYLNLAAYRSGQFPIIMDSSGVRYELWFRNGTTNSDLVLKYPQTLTVDSSVYATKYYVDTGKTAIRTEITTKLDKTLASGKIFVGNGSNIATAVTPSGDVSTTVGGSFTIQPNVVSYSKIQTNPAGTLIGNPSVSTGNNKAVYGKYGLLFDADSLKVDTAILKSIFAATSTGVDTIYRTAGIDSIYYTKNGFTYAVKDSVGGGGGAVAKIAGTDSVTQGGSFIFRDSVQWGVTKYAVIYSSTNNIRSDASSMIVLPNGTWMIAYTAYNTNSIDLSSAIIAVRRSTDRGRTWSTVDTAVHNTAFGAYIPSLFLRPDGTVILLYDHQPTDTTSIIRKVSLSAPYTVGTWSAPSNVYGDSTQYFAPAADRLFLTANNVLLYPLSIATKRGSSSADSNFKGALLASYDYGTSWLNVSTFNNISPDTLCGEPGIYQTNDINKTLYYYYRTRSNDVYCTTAQLSDTSFSGNQLPMNLYAGPTETTIKFLPSQNIAVAVYSPAQPTGQRHMIRMATSYDNFSWSDRYQFDSSYRFRFFEPSITVTENELVVLYSREPETGVDSISLFSNRVPFYYAQQGTPNSIGVDKIVVSKANVFSDPNFLQIHLGRNISPTDGYFNIQNVTQSFNGFGAWIRVKGTTSLPNLWSNEVPTGVNSFLMDGRWGTSTSMDTVHYLFGLSNNDAIKFRVMGDGQTYGTAPPDADSSTRFITSAWFKRNIGSSGSGLSGTTNRIVKFTSASMGGNSSASDDGSFFSLANNANIGSPSDAISGWDLQGHSTTGFQVLFSTVVNNGNGNTWRWEKQRTSANHILSNGDLIGNIDAQGGIAGYKIVANNDLGADNYTNADHQWWGRTNTTYDKHLELTGSGILTLSKRADNSSSDIFTIGLIDVGLTNGFFKIKNQTTGSSSFNNWINTKNTTSSSLWDHEVPATTNGMNFNAIAGGGTVPTSNYIWRFSNNGTAKWTVFGDGGFDAAGKNILRDTTRADARLSYNQNLHSTFTQYTLIDKAYADSAYSGSSLSMGTINSQTKSANGAVITGGTLVMQTADASNVGLMTASQWNTVDSVQKNLYPGDTLYYNRYTVGTGLSPAFLRNDTFNVKDLLFTNGLTPVQNADSTITIKDGGTLTENTTKTLSTLNYTFSQSSTGRLKLSGLKQDPYLTVLGHAADSSVVQLTAASLLSALGITVGNYTPTLTNGTNVTASTAHLCYYYQVGDNITVYGVVEIDPTSTGAIELGMSLPISNDFTDALQVGGGGHAGGAGQSIGAYSDATNDRISFQGSVTSASNAIYSFQFSYIINHL